MTTKVILAHLTKGEYPFGTFGLVPLVLGCLLINWPYIGRYALSPPLWWSARVIDGAIDSSILLTPTAERFYLRLVLVASGPRVCIQFAKRDSIVLRVFRRFVLDHQTQAGHLIDGVILCNQVTVV